MSTTMRMFLAATVATTATLAGAPGAGAATSDPVATTIEVPLPRANDTVVDPVRHLAYVSSHAEGRIAAVDLTSGESTLLPRLPGASELSLDASGDHLWVSLRTEGELARVSTSAPYDVTYFPLGGDLTCPGELLAVAGKVYVLTDSCDGQFDQLWVLDPSTGNVEPSRAMSASGVYSARLQQVPGTTRFFWQERYLSSNDAGIIDAATDELLAKVDGVFVIGSTPDGSGLLEASGDVLSTETLASIGTWVPPTVDGARLADSAVGGTGLLAVPATAGLVVYDLAAAQVVRTWRTDDDPPGVRQALWEGGAALAVAGSEPVTLMRVADPLAPATSRLDVEDPDPDEAVSPGGTWTVQGRLTDGAGTGIADAPVEVRAPSGLLTTATTTGDGSWSVDIVVDDYQVEVVFPGSAFHEAAAASVRTPLSRQSNISVEAPAEAAPVDTLRYEGTVLHTDGRPVPDQAVTVEWDCGNRSFSGIVSTDDDGIFRYDTPVPRCLEVTVRFGVRYGFDPMQHTTATTTLSWRTAVMTTTGPDRLLSGETGTWTATLLIDGQSAAGRVLDYTAWEGGDAERGTLTTDHSGTATLTTGAFGAGTSAIHFRFPGDATTLGATAEAPTVVTPWLSVLTAEVATSRPVAGRSLTLAGTLALGDGSTPEGRVITLSRSGEQLDSTTVRADGTFELTTVPAFATSPGTMNYDVRFTGDWRHSRDEVAVRVVVEQQPTTLTSRVATSPTGDERARVVAVADPGYAGMCLNHRLDRRTSDGWRTVRTTGCRVTDDRGRSSFRTPVLRSGATYRVRARFDGDDRTAADRGTWKRFTAR
ncbi:hypothetical protein GCM10009623_10530 [Nocardioides aestuarii]|uniref:Carboxypeptidase regulatory-like domain-containing protein n=1 Tax=Nocardioides aestuarii TaxID=252231 RepID=A0ABW4TII8_9ACTN